PEGAGRRAAVPGVPAELRLAPVRAVHRPGVEGHRQADDHPGIKYVSEDVHVDADVNQKSRQPFHSSHTFTQTLYFFTANYKIQDNWSAYAQYATGFLVPDISVTQVVSPNLSDLNPQKSTNYQIGTVYHGDRITVDADVYYIEFKNKLQSVSVT